MRQWRNAELSLVAGQIKQFPEETLPEIAIIGKSNVGKSTLLNTLTEHKSLARVSSSPGKTRTLNWFSIDGAFYLVDLPGYGYAKASKAQIEAWSRVINHYLEHRRILKGIVLLVDIRHDPGKNDIIMINYIRETNLPFVVAATKKDKISRGSVPKQLKAIASLLGIEKDRIVPVSSTQKDEELAVLKQKIEALALMEA